MNYEDMSDHEINMAVTCIDNGCQGWSVLGDNSGFYHCGIDGSGFYEVECVDYCNNPSDAWPIIVENKISIAFGSELTTVRLFTCTSAFEVIDKNPLRDAMICFLKMKDEEK